MLYERWRKVVQEFRGEIALIDSASGQRWTFQELAAMGHIESVPEAIGFPQGNSVDFILSVLRAWKNQRVVCPVEVGQTVPNFPFLPSNCVHLKLTSGTTGAVKAVAFQAEQLIADARNICATMRLRSDWPNVGVISLAHSYGFSNLVLPLLLHGIPLILVPTPLPELVRNAVQRFVNVTLPAVPALWRVWHEADALPKNIRLAISAGAPLPLALESDIFERRGLKIHNFYGSSECGGIAYDRSEVPRTEASYVGDAMEGVDISVGENGCLEVRSQAVAESYWPETNEALGKGVFRTADIAEILDGRVHLRGRAGDQINVAGRKVSPETVERFLIQHPAVRDCLVFGAPSDDAERTDMIVACVVVRGEARPNDLKQFLLTHLSAWQMPREWWFVDSLAVNQRGKLSRSEWRTRYLDARRGARKPI